MTVPNKILLEKTLYTESSVFHRQNKKSKRFEVISSEDIKVPFTVKCLLLHRLSPYFVSEKSSQLQKSQQLLF